MGHLEDFWWDTSKEIKELGLEKQFNEQLEKMNGQDKHRYKDIRAKWEYAFNKVLKKNKKNNVN